MLKFYSLVDSVEIFCHGVVIKAIISPKFQLQKIHSSPTFQIL